MFGLGNEHREKAKAWSADVARGKKIKKAHEAEIARRKAEAKERKREAQEKKRLAELDRRRQRLLAEGSLYEAKARKKKAKRAAGFQFPILPTKKVKIRKKRQGRKLSSKRRIGLV